jgi:4-hydroxythreonine-4-phosphate dehydrogenase
LLKYLEKIGPCRIFAPAYLKSEKNIANVSWESFEGEEISPGKPSKESGRQAFEAFQNAAGAVREGRCSALLTLPLSKEHVALSRKDFTGHTRELARWWSGKALMLLIGGPLRVALVSEHLSLKEAVANLTSDVIVEKGRILREALKKYRVKDRALKLHLLALNPHAGDGGLAGEEEERIIRPALERLNQEEALWEGPHSADAFFARGNFGDGVLCLYHDQGLIPVKMLAGKEGGVNLTLGLPFLRSSPDHGTAFDIAGKGRASATSFFKALVLLRKLLEESQNAPAAVL